MPFKIMKTTISEKKKYAVVNADTGDVKGYHATRKKAQAQLRALYANVPEARS